MSSIKLESNASGTGVFSIASPNSNTNRTLTLPDQTGTVLTGSGAIGVNASAPTNSIAIDSSGNVGIGTTSPSTAANGGLTLGTTSAGKSLILNSSSSGNNGLIRFIDSNGSNSLEFVGGTSQVSLYGYGSRDMLFWTNGTERARITSGGTFFINNSTAINSEILNVRQSSSANLTGIAVGYGSSGGQWRSMSITSSNIMTFNNGLNEGTLSSAGAWTNASDARLKTNIRDIEYGLNTVLIAKPRHFERVDVEGTYIGFVAQELQTVIPEVVSGDPETQFGVDYGSLVAVAFKAIQELNAKVETLEAQNAAFEARLAALETK